MMRGRSHSWRCKQAAERYTLFWQRRVMAKRPVKLLRLRLPNIRRSLCLRMSANSFNSDEPAALDINCRGHSRHGEKGHRQRDELSRSHLRGSKQVKPPGPSGGYSLHHAVAHGHLPLYVLELGDMIKPSKRHKDKRICQPCVSSDTYFPPANRNRLIWHIIYFQNIREKAFAILPQFCWGTARELSP